MQQAKLRGNLAGDGGGAKALAGVMTTGQVGDARLARIVHLGFRDFTGDEGVGTGSDGRRFALGASGGRKILGAVLQLSSFLMDHGMSLEDAFHQPRIDVSGSGQITADRLLDAAIQEALVQEMPTSTARRTVFPYAFACPAGVLRDGVQNMGCTEIMSPWGDAVAG